MNRHPATITPTHLFRGAFCLVIAISLALVGPMLGQTKTGGPLNSVSNVNLSLSPSVPGGLTSELVNNGGFETGNFTGWTQSGNTGFTGVDMSSAHSGTYGAFFGPTTTNGFITQNLATTVGILYDLTFWLKNDGGAPNHFEVSWDGGMLNSINDGPAMPYTPYIYAGLAVTTTSTQLQFGFRDDPSFWRLDDVSVKPHRSKAPPDFNQDTHPDLLLFQAATRRTSIWFLNNNMFIGSHLGPTLPPGWKVIDATDFNGDTKPDYVLFNASNRRTAIWYLNGTSFVSSVFGPTPPPGWALVSTGDFNGDEHPDFVLFNASTRQTAIWFLNNNMFIGSHLGPTLTAGWSLVGVADFNLNGRSDYLLFNSSTRQTQIWYLNGTAFVSSVSGPTPPMGWALIGVADFDLDGYPDFLLFNASTRKTAIWYLHNNMFVSSAFGPTTPVGWEIVAP